MKKDNENLMQRNELNYDSYRNKKSHPFRDVSSLQPVILKIVNEPRGTFFL